MKRTLIFLFLCIPLMALAQTTLTPEQKLEQAQRQLEEAKAALEQAKANAAKAKAEAEAKAKKEAEDKAKASEVEKKIAEMNAEAERLSREAAALREAANKAQTGTKTTTTKANTTTNTVGNTTSDAWVVPTTAATAAVRTKDVDTDSKANKDIYLQKGLIPEVNGQVMWTETISVPGASADELYDKAFAYLTALTQDKNQLEGSKVALVNKGEHSIVATMREKLIFSSSFLSLDFTQFNYVLQATCRDGEATLTMNRLTYRYDVQGNVSDLSAEQWITDKYAVNKKHTRLLPVSGKFRRATVDRKNAIFDGFAQALK